MKRDLCYAVIGAGNGGLAMAGYLSLIGYEVNLYNRTLENILPLIGKPTIKLSGEVEGDGKLNIVTNNIEEAIEGADIIMITIPAMGHYQLGKQMAPFLKDDQVIVLNPGRTGGALEVYAAIRQEGCDKNIVVAEAQTFIYACRATSRNSAHIFRSKNEVTLAAIPSTRTNEVIDMLYDAYPQFKPAKDVIETSINNYGAIFHPAPTLLNSGHIERGAPFEYYTEGITPSIGNFLEKMDAERMKIGTLLNVNTLSAKDWLEYTYDAKGHTLYEAIQNNPGYKGLQAPKGLNIRYIYEDVPYSLVPMSSMAKELGIETPAIDSIIRIAELITGIDFFKEGRTMKRLGLKGLKVKQIHQLAEKGSISTKGEGEVVAS
jgi:opine dehydrogenase